jgi:hypothetical protein
MPRYDLAYYDEEDQRIGEESGFEAPDLAAALVYASNYLPRFQGNAHVVCVTVEKVIEPAPRRPR